MERETVRFDELRLLVPAMGRAEARALGRDVARALGDGLATTSASAELGRLDLRVRVPRGTEREALAEAVTRAIVERLS